MGTAFIYNYYMNDTQTIRVKSSRIENGVEFCNTCCRQAATPFRYKDSWGRERGCVASCHDAHVARTTKPKWMAPRMVLPKWITDARRAMPMFERAKV